MSSTKATTKPYLEGIPGPGLFKSSDSGFSWENIFESIDAVALLIDEEDNIYIGANREVASPKGIWISENNGQSWDTVNQTGLTNPYIENLYLDNNGHLYSLPRWRGSPDPCPLTACLPTSIFYLQSINKYNQ